MPANYPTIQAAINAVISGALPSGTTISVDRGVYAEALQVANTAKSLTVRGVDGAGVTIVDAAGRGAAGVHVYRATGRVEFEGLTFRNGTPPVSAGGGFVIQESSPIFTSVVFEANRASFGGGGTLITSNAVFTSCVIRNNIAERSGGGVYMVAGSRPVFTSTEITGNRSGAGPAGVGDSGVGGGVDARDSSPTFRGSRISGNTSVFAAGGIYHGGDFTSSYGTAILDISDSEVADNVSAPFTPSAGPAEGGGIHIEDNATARLTRVRVLRNRANTGGGLNAYRARFEIVDSVVDGNRATGRSDGGIGGGITASSTHTGSTVRPSSVVVLTRSLVRNNVGLTGGGVAVTGEVGRPGTLTITGSVIDSNSANNQGGGLLISHANLTATNSLITRNTVSGGQTPFGGGLMIATSSAATITQSTLASNTAAAHGGGIFMDGTTQLDLRNSRIFNNVTNNANGFGGGGLFVGPNGSNTGSVIDSIIADNTQYQIFENQCPKATLTYNNNTITPRTGATDLYVSACSPFATVSAIGDFNNLGNTSANNSAVPRFAHFLAAPGAGTNFTLAWSVARATSVTISGVGAWNSATGAVDVAPASSTNYSLTATATSANGGSYAAMSTGVSVVAPPSAREFVPGDFTGDSRAEIGIFRPSNGIWYVRNGPQVTWGGGSDIPVSGDFDGDARDDVAVFRPSTGVWYILRSSGGSAQYTWGGGSDIPVAADYDGDGRTDIAVFRRSTGTWYILYVGSNTSVSYAWGGGGDIPVQADYDGDGRTDVAVFRPATGTFYIRQSSAGTTLQFAWGGNGDIPVPGDYDGDGRADFAVFRPSANAWYIYRIGSGTSVQYNWGGVGDTPVPGDYDGDGVTDVAIFRSSTGGWYIRYSSTGAAITYTWGGSGDLAVLRR